MQEIWQTRRFKVIVLIDPPSFHFNPRPVILSEQQLVDCDVYDGGCAGGWYTNAWKYLKNVTGGSAQQSFYAYTATVNTWQSTVSYLLPTLFRYLTDCRNRLNSEKYLQIQRLHERSQDFLIRWPSHTKRHQYAISCADLRSSFGCHRRRQFFLLIQVGEIMWKKQTNKRSSCSVQHSNFPLSIALQQRRLHWRRVRQCDNQSRCGPCRLGSPFRDRLLDSSQFVGNQLGKRRLRPDAARSQQMQHRVISRRHYIGRLREKTTSPFTGSRPVSARTYSRLTTKYLKLNRSEVIISYFWRCIDPQLGGISCVILLFWWIWIWINWDYSKETIPSRELFQNVQFLHLKSQHNLTNNHFYPPSCNCCYLLI